MTRRGLLSLLGLAPVAVSLTVRGASSAPITSGRAHLVRLEDGFLTLNEVRAAAQLPLINDIDALIADVGRMLPERPDRGLTLAPARRTIDMLCIIYSDPLELAS